MSKLIICEKKSLAEHVAKALNCNILRQGYFTNANDINVTWCLGHLFGRIEPNDQWKLSKLPILQEPSKNQVQFYRLKTEKAGVKKQFDIIKQLLTNAEEVVNCCDPDVEGETIFREVVEYLNCNTNQTRMWFKDLTENELQQAFINRKDINEYQGLREKGYARNYFDWLYGINLTQLTSLLSSETYTVGRVQTPTLKMIVDRYFENKNFTSIKKYLPDILLSEFDDLQLKCKEHELFNSKESVNNYIKSNPILTLEIGNETQAKIKPPTLHDLGSIQKWANSNLNISSKQTLQILQKLYENKIISYPRTDCHFITNNTANRLSNILNRKFKSGIGEVSAHEAITPISKYVDSLDELSQAIYDEIYYTTLANTYEPISVVKFKINYHDNMNNITWSKGLTKNISVDNTNVFKTAIPYFKDFKISNEVEASFYDVLQNKSNFDYQMVLREYETKPKPLFTESSLISKMENIHNEFEDKTLIDISKDTQGIGTPATRADIINKLFVKEYIVKQKNKLIPTEKGIKLIDKLQQLNNPLLNVEYSANLECQLNNVEFNKNLDKFIEIQNKTLTDYINSCINVLPSKICKCGSPLLVVDGKYGEYLKCSNCEVQMPNHNFSQEELDAMFRGEKSNEKTLTSKTGKTYTTSFIYDINDNKLKSTLDVINEKKEQGGLSVCQCNCGGEIKLLKGSYGDYFKCMSCGLTISNQFKFSLEELKNMLNGGHSKSKNWISQSGRKLQSSFVIVDNKLQPDFKKFNG